MKRLAIIASALLSVSTLDAAELNRISAGDIKAVRSEVPAPLLSRPGSWKCAHVTGEISKLHLLAQASGSRLSTYADTEAQFGEFLALWQPILEKFGMKVTGAEFKNNYGILKYESPDGSVIRDFMAENLSYNALDSAEVANLQHQLLEPLEQAAMTPIASFTIKHEAFRPTFNIYYLTKPEENADHEQRLRQLKNGEDIDFDLLTGAVKLVKKDSSFSLVYIGRELGFKTRLAANEAGIASKLADYRKFLAENKKEFIASRTAKLDTPIVFSGGTLNYYVNIYFFQ